MTAFTTLTSGDLDPDSPITATVAGAWYYNVPAAFEGNAPFYLASNAIAAGTLAANRLVNNSLTQTQIAAGAVGQSELKATSGTVSTNSTTGAVLTLPGGNYGYWPRLKSDNASGWAYVGYNHSAGLGSYSMFVVGTSYVTSISLTSNNSSYTATALQYYVQASPPYDLGDGEIPLFVFVEVDPSGNVVSAYAAPEAPWHYNGPTDIRGKQFYDTDPQGNIVGTKYLRSRKDSAEISAGLVAAGLPATLTRAEALALGPAALADYLSAFAAAPDVWIPITQDVKNADMALIPRPMDPQPGNTVIMLDPVAQIGADMLEFMKHDEFNLNELLHSGDIIIDNVALSRATPPGVNAHTWRLR